MSRLRNVERRGDAVAEAAVNVAFGLAMRINRRRYWPGLVAATADPADAQAAVLDEILERNASTIFGRRYGFAGLVGRGVDAYRRAVPVQDYESLRPLIEEQERTGAHALTVERPSIYAQTSGTSGTPKYLPITDTGVARVARIQRLFASAVHAGTDMFSGKIVGIGSPAIEGSLPGGSPFGSASGLVYEGMPNVVRRKYVLPPEVLAIDDHDLRYRVIAMLCLAERNVTGVATANPSTLLRLRSVMVEEWGELVTAIEVGRVPDAGLTEHARSVIERRLRGDPARAAALARIRAEQGDAVGYRHVWPRLAAITTWTGGSAGFALTALAPHLDRATRIVELGYSASEVRGTIGIDPASNLCAPLPADNHYEFVARSLRETSPDGAVADPAAFLGLDELEPGSQYYVYVTTFDGLYRYDMNDIVEVTGRFQATPTLTFVQKGRGVTNITGEKLTESQVLAAVDGAQAELGLALTFFVALADEAGARYRLYTEDSLGRTEAGTLAAMVDERLTSTNIEYGSKRGSGRLGPIVGVDLVPGTAEAYRAACVAEGQRDAQFKYLHLQYGAQCPFDFDRHRASVGGAR